MFMEARPDKGPGIFKTQSDRAGPTIFVAPDLVNGTLEQGFAFLNGLSAPFHRAAFMMFPVSEVHPFADGNGRAARIMMNAELLAEGQERIIVPMPNRLSRGSASVVTRGQYYAANSNAGLCTAIYSVDRLAGNRSCTSNAHRNRCLQRGEKAEVATAAKRDRRGRSPRGITEVAADPLAVNAHEYWQGCLSLARCLEISDESTAGTDFRRTQLTASLLDSLRN